MPVVDSLLSIETPLCEAHLIRCFLLPGMMSDRSVLALLTYSEYSHPLSVWATDWNEVFHHSQWDDKRIKVWKIAFAHDFLRWSTFPIDFSRTVGNRFLPTAQGDLDICHALCCYGEYTKCL